MFFTLFLASFVSATLWPLASEAMFVSFLHQNPDALLPLLMMASFGNSLGSIAMFELSFSSQQFIQNRFSRKKKELEQWKGRLKKHGSPILVLAWLPLVGDFLPIAAGLLQMSRITAYFWIAVGKLGRYWILAWFV